MVLQLKSVGFSTDHNLFDIDHICDGKGITPTASVDDGDDKCDNNNHSNSTTLKTVENFFNHHDFSAFLSFNEFRHHHHNNNNEQQSISDNFCTNLNKLRSSIVTSLLPPPPLQHQPTVPKIDTLKPNNDEIFRNDESLSTIFIYFLSDILINQPFGDSLTSISKSFKKFFNISDKLFQKLFKKSLSLTKYYLLEISKNKEYYTKLQDDIENEEFKGDKELMENIKAYQLGRIGELEKKNKEIKYLNFLNTVWIKIYNANGLIIKDLISSDPYVNLFFTDHKDEKPHHQRESLVTANLNHSSKPHHHHFKTTVKKKTLSPEYNEEFLMSTDKPDQNILVATLYDFDQISKSDFLGFVPIHLDDGNSSGTGTPDESNTGTDHHEHSHLLHSLDENIQQYELLSKPKGALTQLKSILGIKGHVNVLNDNETRKFGSIKIGIINLKREILNVSDAISNLPPSKEIESLITTNSNNGHIHENAITSLYEFLLKVNQNYNLPKEIESLLVSFKKRVLISPVLVNIILVEKLIINFDISTSCIDEICKVIKEIIHQITIEKIPLSKPLQDRFSVLLKSVKKLFKDLVKKYPLSFPVTINPDTNQPENIGSSGTLLTISFEILEFIYHYQSKDFNLKLVKIVDSYIEFCWSIVYEKSLLSIEDTTSFENIVQLLQVYESIELQLKMDEMYSQFFPPQFDLSSHVSNKYYNKLRVETELQLEKETKVCMETFNLLKSIQSIEKFIKPYKLEIENGLMDLNKLFSRFISMWMIEIKKQYQCWIVRSLEKEEWQSIDSKNKLLHSNSTIDLFTMFEIGKNHLIGIDLNIDQFLFEFIEIVNSMYNYYLELVSNSILIDLKNDNHPLFFDEVNDLIKSNISKLITKIKSLEDVSSNQQRKESSSSPSSTDARIINSTICIKLNSMEFSRQLLFDFSSDLELKLPHLKEKIQDSFGISFYNSKKKYDYIIDLVINNINKWIKVLIHQILDNHNNKTIFNGSQGGEGGSGTPIILNDDQINEILESLILLLNNELSILSGNLYYPTFSKFIKGVWQSIWKEFDIILFPEFKIQQEKKESLALKSSIILSIYPTLEQFFYADGAGISIDQLRNHSEYLLSTISVYFTGSKNLLEIYNHLESVGYLKSKYNYELINSDLFNIKQLQEFTDFKFNKSNYIRELHIVSSISSYLNHYHHQGNGNNGSGSSEEEDKIILEFKKIVSNIGSGGGSASNSFKNRFILDKFSLDSSVSNFKIDFNCKTLYGIQTNAYLMNDCICWSSLLCLNETKVVLKYSSIVSIVRQLHENNDILIKICVIPNTATITSISDSQQLQPPPQLNEIKEYQIWSISNNNQNQVFNCLVSSSKHQNPSIEITDYTNDPDAEDAGDNSNFIINPSSVTQSPISSTSVSVNLKNDDHNNHQYHTERQSHVSYDDSITYHTQFHLDKDNTIYDIYPCFSGKIITTRDYFCHYNTITKSNKHVLWSEIVEIKKESVLFFQTGIKISFKNTETISYSGINNRDRLYNELVELRDLNKSKTSPILSRK